MEEGSVPQVDGGAKDPVMGRGVREENDRKPITRNGQGAG